MLKGAFLVETSAELLIEVALGHLRHIVFVKKLAIVALLTETAKPMLAHYGPIASDKGGSNFAKVVRRIWEPKRVIFGHAR